MLDTMEHLQERNIHTPAVYQKQQKLNLFHIFLQYWNIGKVL